MNIIEFKNISKSFLGGKIIANDDVSFSIKEGEVHAIIGENGAGKTTLMSMLFGLYSQDKGEIIYKGKKANFKSAKDAADEGLGMVYQHFQLIKNFTVAENVTLGIEKGKFGFISMKESIKKIQEISDKYNFNIKPKQKVKNLTVGEMQRVEIIKLLYKDVDVLILDEPTAMLSPREIEDFLKIVLDFKKAGKTIIFISHKLDEIKAVADHATVLRKGKHIKTFVVKDTSTDQMASYMVGRDVVASKPLKVGIKDAKTILQVKNLSTKRHHGKSINNFNFEIKAGEILGVAGVEGNGQTRLVNAISGLNYRQIKKGSIILNGQDITKKSIAKRYKIGMAHIPEDRHKHGMFLDLKLYESIAMKEYQKKGYSKFFILNKKKIKEYSRAIINKYDVRGANRGHAPSRGLSGGNQQKAVVGREVDSNFELLIAFQVTRGLDIGAIEFIHSQMNKAKAEGKAILLVTYDLNEAISLSDRVIVLNSGQITGELKGKDITKTNIGKLMVKKGEIND